VSERQTGSTERADDVIRELEEAESICSDPDCEICPDPDRGLCSGATETLTARVEWALEELTSN
jgi:hypothetical protein